LAPLGRGVGWIVQLVPFHRSARGTEAALREYPTAVHTALAGHEMLYRMSSCAPGGCAVLWIDQPGATAARALADHAKPRHTASPAKQPSDWQPQAGEAFGVTRS
jgi:hypothetical protein